MYFSFILRQMLNYSVINCIVLYFICTLNICILYHTVNSTNISLSHSNDSLSNEIKNEQFKKEDRKRIIVEVENKSRNAGLVENKVTTPVVTNVTVHNKSSVFEYQLNSTAKLPTWMNIDENAFKRTGIVVLGFVSIVLVFFVVKAVRLRRKRSKSRKYGIITSTASDMEMEPLDKDDDEEEDTTLFDAQHKYSLQ